VGFVAGPLCCERPLSLHVKKGAKDTDRTDLAGKNGFLTGKLVCGYLTDLPDPRSLSAGIGQRFSQNYTPFNNCAVQFRLI
jgi:hypothetical protein